MEAPSGRGRLRGVLVALVAVGLSAAAYAVLSARSLPGAAALRERLHDRGTVAIVGRDADDLARVDGDGTRLVPARELAGVDAALAGHDADRLASALDAANVDTILVDERRPPARTPDARAPLATQLAGLRHVPGLHCTFAGTLAAVYERDLVPKIEPPVDAALARVARELLAGARPPRIGSFPEPARRIGPEVEVMVMTRQNGRPRLWRSSRGDSIARGLITAATAARGRWTERETSLGVLATSLPTLDVEVSILARDGELGDRTPAFLDRAITPEHGVGYDDREGWRYVLPELLNVPARHRGVAGFGQLFGENGVRDGLARRDLVLFRFVVTVLGRSPATPAN